MKETKQSRGPLSPLQEYREHSLRGTVLALALAVLLHVVGFLIVPAEIFTTAEPRTPPEPIEVELVSAPKKPDELRYVEANPEVAENEPDETPNYSFQDQQAADESDDPREADAPDAGGDEATQKIVQGLPQEPSPEPPGVVVEQAAAEGEADGTEGGTPGIPEVAAVPLQPPPTPDFLQEEPRNDDGEGSRIEITGEADEADPQSEPSETIQITQVPDSMEAIQSGDGQGGEPDARPTPRQRPRLSPDLVRGPLRKSEGSVARRGTLAIDATFSEFGEYQQQLYAAIQNGWYNEIEFFRPMDTAAYVHLRFLLKSNGEVSQMEVVETTAGEVATVICQTAIEKRSPFRPWTKEMVEVFGNQRKLELVFRYL